MKKISFLLLSLFMLISPVFADTYINLDQFLRSYLSTVTQTVKIPDSYKYIDLKFTNVPAKSALYSLLQKAVYLNIFPNSKTDLPLSKHVTQYQATTIVAQAFSGVEIGDKRDFVSMDWLANLLKPFQDQQIKQYATTQSQQAAQDLFTKSDLYQDVLYRIQSKYYYQSGLNTTGMLYGGIQGLVNGLNDPYTSFFPPVEADQFEDQLQGEFFGIGAYVSMDQPGVFIITATMDNSPAQKAGLIAQDRIVQVDDHVIDDKVSLSQAIQWIKGPSDTQVTLKYLREGKLATVVVTRKKIVVPNLSSKIITGQKENVCLISLRMFDLGVANRFEEVLDGLQNKHCSKYIFDLRNNPGGSLEEVLDMLDYFVSTGSPVVSVKTKTTINTYFAHKTTYKLTGDVVRILINKGSASASEIFAGVVREYIPSAMLVGVQSFGKGSVQDLTYYDDGSMLKYTIAKWYTGKEDINIDKIGFTPDIKIEDKVGTGTDAILDWAVKN